MKVFLTGATGVMGLSAIRALHEAGHTVVGLARSAGKATQVANAGAEPHRGDLYDRDKLIDGMRGCDAVCNLATHVPVGSAGMTPGAWKANDRIRTEGSRIVIEAARRAGVTKVVQQSLSFVYGDHGDDWIDEHSPIDITRYAEPIVVAESHVEEFAREDGDGVSLRFGLITGPDENSAWLLKRARAGKPTGMGPRQGWCHVIHPDDVGTAVAAALTVPSGVYNAGAEPIQRKDLVDVYAQAAGHKEGKFYGPLVMKLAGQKAELITRSQRVSSQRFSDRTGWHPQYPKLTPDWFDCLERRHSE
ncbi:MAG: NAD(P)-dependent oxidoreductase [Actinomycetota bacterium]|nr:NAD(P)-dependent oxidoreductase [Actinomycetota bacterium]